MHKSRPTHGSQSYAEYATYIDFCKTFAKDLQPLYLLAFLLTGNHAEAEQCFVAGVEDAVRAKTVFKGWERSWSRRCLIIDAIRRVSPSPAEAGGQRDASYEVEVESGTRRALDAVTRLVPLQRFVFVMSVLEGYSEHECALLLGCAPRAVYEGRSRALWQLSAFDPVFTKSPDRQQQLTDVCVAS